MIKPWISKYEMMKEGLRDIKGRMDGTIKSFKTPWESVNDAGTNGIEFGSITVIAGRPGSGKTLIKDCIVREADKYNQELSFDILEFSLELPGKISAKRELSAVVKRSYKEINSSYEKLDDLAFDQMKAYALSHKTTPAFIVHDPPTIDDFEETIHEFMKSRATIKTDVKGNSIYSYRDTIITYDHGTLTKNKRGSNKTDTLQELGESMTKLKKMYPIAFIILSQLNRESESPERNEEGKYGNYILDSDLFAGDALLQHADLVIGINNPSKKHIRFYGPERYIMTAKTIVMHFLKVRNGDVRMSFFENRFEHMSIVEIPPPAKSVKIKK